MPNLTSDVKPRIVNRLCIYQADEVRVFVESDSSTCSLQLAVSILLVSQRQYSARFTGSSALGALRFNEAVQFNNNTAGYQGGGIYVGGGEVT